jgi:hypothetical protein
VPEAPFSLHDIRDVRGFCSTIASRRLSLSRDDREDLEAYLVSECWKLSLSYQRGNPKFPPRFSVHATRVLSLRTVDWMRQRFGRTRWQFAGHTYERERPRPLSLDDGVVADRLGQALSPVDGDHETGRDEDLRRLYAERDRCRDRDLALLGLEPDGRAA